jgi:hypothetical protein
VIAHGLKMAVDDTLAPAADVRDNSCHVVVDPAFRDPLERCESVGMGVEEHLLALSWVCDEKERAACTKDKMRHLQALGRFVDHNGLCAPIELKGFTKLEKKRYDAFWGWICVARHWRTKVKTRLRPPV